MRRADVLVRTSLWAMAVAVLVAALALPMSALALDHKLKTLADLRGTTIGMVSGGSFDRMMEKDETLQGDVKISYQNSVVDATASLLGGKVDAVIGDLPVARSIEAQHKELMVFPDVLAQDHYGFGFAKGSPLVAPFNEALHKLLDEGISDELSEKWITGSEEGKVLIEQDWPGKAGTLRYWVNASSPPMGYIGPSGDLVGYSIDLMLHIAREMDYKLVITECSFDGLIPAVQSGKCDVVGGSMSITPERAQMVDFCDPFYDGASVFIIRKADADPSLLANLDDTGVEEAKPSSPIESLRTSFQKTFVDEDRWKIFATGLATTLVITLASAALGTVLGFVIYLLCRKLGSRFKRFVDFLTGLIVGIPVVVLLMVFFYIVFGSLSIGGVVVSIITFTLLYGVAVYNMMQRGANAVDYGQTEGSYALGFTDRETYFNVIFPQALEHMLPMYKGELTSLLKSTAVVGYIAVQDLTRAGDMVRNRTFEAFFALISVAVIYYVMGLLMAWSVDLLQHHFDPTRRSPDKILKGIDANV